MSKKLIIVSIFLSLSLGGSAQPNLEAGYILCKNLKRKTPQMVQLPRFKDSWQIQRNCEFPRAEHVSFVIEIFYKEWKQNFGDERGLVLKTLNGLMIEWGEKKKPITGAAFGVDGKMITGQARGLTLMPGYIWVWENKYDRIAATALLHELVHSALWAQNGRHGDPDHEGTDFQGWTSAHTKLINKINSLLANLDI